MIEANAQTADRLISVCDYADDPYRRRWLLVEDAGARMREAAARGRDVDSGPCPYDDGEQFGAVCRRVWDRERASAVRVASVRAASAAGRDVESGGNPYDPDSPDYLERVCHRVWRTARGVALYGRLD